MSDLETMVAWAAATPNPTGRTPCATIDMIQKHFRCGLADAIRTRRDAAKVVAANAAKVPPEGVQYEEKGNQATLTTVSREIRTAEDALAYGEVDTVLWEVERFVVNSWEMGAKLGPTGPIAVTPLWQVKVWLRRKSPLGMALERLIERMPEKAPRRPKPRARKGDRMVEVALYDLHWGMLAWAKETGENYDIHITRAIQADATAQITDRTKALKPAYYLLPIGNDFLHVNDPQGLTPRNRNRLDVDTRLARIFAEAELAMRDTIDALSAIAPVKVLWVPGNHDPQTSYYLLQALAAWYRKDGRVEIDTSPKPRKVHLFGINLIGFLHGCELARSKDKALAGLLADEAADLWAPGQYREIHRGHTHKKAELYFVGADTYGSVVVRTIPSLVGTDFWHYEMGFVQTSKTAQFFVWARDYGLEAVCDVHMDPKHYR